ncbi:MAG TPA: hypothetical protein VMR44_11190 [Thermoanaerobaculia bacterium]|nr:hypothetical protein [Thermoanaerobaculia bacterium]
MSKEEMDQALEEAQWQAGPIRLAPWIGLRDLSWNDNPRATPEGEDAEGDVSMTAGAGLRAYLPTGPDVYWAAHALPEYVWYADQTDRRRLNGRYGAGVFGFFNRLTLEATAQRIDELGILTAEVPEQANSREDRLSLGGEVELGFSTSVFAQAETGEIRTLLDEEERESGPALQRLDRDQDRLRAGLRYRPRERWTFSLGMEWTETRVLNEEQDLSSSGEAPLAEISYRGPKFFASVESQLRSLEPEGDSIFPATEATTYALRLGLEGNRLSPTLYAHQSLALAISQDYSHFETQAVGVAMSLSLGHRTKLSVFAEAGRSDFTALSAEVPTREDDLTAFGGDLSISLGRFLSFRLGGYRAEFDSNLPGEDRSLSVLSTGVSLGISGDDGPGWP